LLQLARLDQVAVQRIIDTLQFGQRRAQQAVLVMQFALHFQQAFARLHPGPQF
jgi:hypothetical protein